MRNKKIVNIKDLLANSGLAKIMQKSTALNMLADRLEAVFPPQFQGLYRVANIENGVLVLEVKNATVRQALIFKQAELLQSVQQLQADISTINIKVNPQV